MTCHIDLNGISISDKTIDFVHSTKCISPELTCGLSIIKTTAVVLLVALPGGAIQIMTRPKVSEDKRQRTAHACDSCKRRKQKVSS